MSKVLIKDGTVLSLDRAVGNMVEADVLIEDGMISEVGKSLRARNADVIDATDTVVMPGFVDTHRHLWQSLIRNSGTTMSAEVAGHYTPDDVYAATLVGLLGALEAGVTTVVDWCDIPGDAAHFEAALTAHADSGARTVLVPSRADIESDTTALAFSSPAIVAADLDSVVASWSLARQAGRRIHAHAGTAAASGGEVAELGSRGLLGPDVTLAHCTRLSDADFDAIAASAAAVALTPASDMAGGVGSPPMQQLIDRGIRPGLGVGDEQLAPGDIFAQMRAAISVQHATLFDLKLAGKGGVPNLLNTREVMRYATIDGARVAGLSDITGSLSPGKRADVVVLRADRPNIAPVNDPIGAVVWGMDTSNIDWVFVGGSPMVSKGELTADVARAGELAVTAQGKVAVAAGLDAGSGKS
ncbi:MAG: amidohydrolase family protein [Acidimicrobiia bacterium]|nr:amidohydrolase family protein [Acidimicrobiia bacterium]